jgi:predicted dienelactone hydrolase
MFWKRVFFVVLLAAMIVPALAILPSAGAQEGPKPEAVGLRPDAPPYAVHGPYWVGTREFVVEPDSDRPLPLTAWYPALNPEGVAEEIEYHDVPGDTSPILGHALLNAPADPSGGPYPLVIYSHGSWDNRFGSDYYTEHLASYGFVVLAPDHTGNTTVNAGQSQHRHNIYRPQDVIRVIDFAVTLTSSGEALDGMIDTDTVAVTGWSFGAWTSLAAAGAQMNLKAYETWCAENPQSDPFQMGVCTSYTDHEEELAALAGLDAVPEGLWPPIADARVKAVIPLAPGGTAAFGADGLAPVKIPVMIMVGAGDQLVPPEYHAYLGYNWLQTDEKALVAFAGANHLLFGLACKDTPWWPSDQFYWCSDPVWDMDRAHDLINHFATAFLLATLKGDKDAAAALAPDQVQFPGITYQAQGF